MAEIAGRPDRARDLCNHLVAEQASEVRTRPARSRATYAGLRETLAAEGARRAEERQSQPRKAAVRNFPLRSRWRLDDQRLPG